LQGPPLIQKGIRLLIDATRQNSGKIATSAHVKREFHYVVHGFFDEVQGRIAHLTDPVKERPCEELWREVKGVLMPKVFPGGRSLLENLGDYITDLYKGRLVRPMFLDSVVRTYREQIIRGFIADKVFDTSTCKVWEAPGGSCSSCKTDPSHECRLKDTCVTNRANFLASATTLASGRYAESDWLKNNLAHLRTLEGKALLEFIGKHPGHVGDLIIFWEVPDGWTILSRDRAFQILTDKHRNEIDFSMVRIPRDISSEACKLRHEGEAAEVEGVLDNYNSQGARVHAPGITARARQRMIIQSEKLGTRVGEVTKFRQPSSVKEAQRNKLRPTFGLKFKTSKAKR
jgi:hypothetical protein